MRTGKRHIAQEHHVCHPLTLSFIKKRPLQVVHFIASFIHPSSSPSPLKAILKHALSYFAKRSVSGLWEQHR